MSGLCHTVCGSIHQALGSLKAGIAADGMEKDEESEPKERSDLMRPVLRDGESVAIWPQ
jgi:hypothetical protein